METDLLKKMKEEIELITLKRKIANLSDEEKNKINKMLNFATNWWIKGVNLSKEKYNAKDTTIDKMYNYIHQGYVSDNQLAKIDDFKSELGFSILKEYLKKPNVSIELHCGYSPDGLLGECIENSQCQFLNTHFPIKSRMIIKKEQIYVKEGYGVKLKLAFDVNNSKDFPTECDFFNYDSIISKSKK